MRSTFAPDRVAASVVPCGYVVLLYPPTASHHPATGHDTSFREAPALAATSDGVGTSTAVIAPLVMETVHAAFWLSPFVSW